MSEIIKLRYSDVYRVSKQLVDSQSPDFSIINSIFTDIKSHFNAIDYPNLNDDIKVVETHLSKDSDPVRNSEKIKKIVKKILVYIDLTESLSEKDRESIYQKISTFKDHYGSDNDIESVLRRLNHSLIDSFLRMVGYLLEHLNDKQFVMQLVLTLRILFSSEKNIDIFLTNLTVILPLIPEQDQKKKFLENIVYTHWEIFEKNQSINLAILFSEPDCLNELIGNILRLSNESDIGFEIMNIYKTFFKKNMQKIKSLEKDFELFLNFKFGSFATKFLEDKNQYLMKFFLGKEEGVDYKIFNFLKKILKSNENPNFEFIFSILAYWSERITTPE